MVYVVRVVCVAWVAYVRCVCVCVCVCDVHGVCVWCAGECVICGVCMRACVRVSV